MIFFVNYFYLKPKGVFLEKSFKYLNLRKAMINLTLHCKIIHTFANFATLPKCFELVSNWFGNRLCLVCFNEGCTKDKRFALIANVFFNRFPKTHHLCVVPFLRDCKWAIFLKKLYTSIQLSFCMLSVFYIVSFLSFNLNNWF